MLRLFAALPVPDEIADALTPLQKRLTAASWRPRENFHVTLRFFGDVSRDMAAALDEEIAQIEAPQLPLLVDGTGWFGRREPHNVYARIRPTEALTALAGACERAARRLGLPADKRRFTPHITLAYLHGAPLNAVQAWTETHQELRAGPFTADRFHLYSSHFGKGPSVYREESEYVLG